MSTIRLYLNYERQSGCPVPPYIELDPAQILGDLPEKVEALRRAVLSVPHPATAEVLRVMEADAPQQGAKPDDLRCGMARAEGHAKPDADEAARDVLKGVIGEATDDELNHKEERCIVDAILAAVRRDDVPGIHDQETIDNIKRGHTNEIDALRRENEALKVARDQWAESSTVWQGDATKYHTEHDRLAARVAELEQMREAQADGARAVIAERDKALAELAELRHNSVPRAEIEAAFRKHGLAAGPVAVDRLVADLAAATERATAAEASCCADQQAAVDALGKLEDARAEADACAEALREWYQHVMGDEEPTSEIAVKASRALAAHDAARKGGA